MNHRLAWIQIFTGLCLWGCGCFQPVSEDPNVASDGGFAADGGHATDAGHSDGGRADAGHDGGVLHLPDGGSVDAGGFDAGAPDCLFPCMIDQRCVAGFCLPNPCNPLNCAGGCCQNDVCVPDETHLQCGTGASACHACVAGQRCSNGNCLANGAGDPCTDDVECAGLGSTAYCRKSTSSMNAVYPGGFCTRPCGRSNPDGGGGCGPGAVCLDALQAFGELDAFCSPACNSKPECRVPDYDCYYVNRAGKTACWLKPLPGEDAGSP